MLAISCCVIAPIYEAAARDFRWPKLETFNWALAGLIGYPIVLLDSDGAPADEGEVCIDLSRRPPGLTPGYLDDGTNRTAEVMRDGFNRTGDVARRDAEGYLVFIGRAGHACSVQADPPNRVR